MTIYDLKLYGVHFPRLIGGANVALADSPEEVFGKAQREYRFEVEVLEQYGSKQDVLQLQFLDGHKEYVTLHEPHMYLDDGEWKPSENNVAEAFLTMYELLKEKETVDIAQSIFDLNFYGMLEDFGLKRLRAKVFLFKVVRDNELTKGSTLFNAIVLKEYKGKKYVVHAITDEGDEAYIPLFEANRYYNAIKRVWDCCNESPIPGEILECYVKYLNE